MADYIKIKDDGNIITLLDVPTTDASILSELEDNGWKEKNAYYARKWRDEELANYDLMSLLSDNPNRSNILAYRQALRDWPSTSDFPDTKPTL